MAGMCFDAPGMRADPWPRLVQKGAVMAIKVIGAGVGRTGTYSLKLAISRLGLGPCHHMEAVIQNMPAQVPLWAAALEGKPDWAAMFDGFNSAVDWPTASFFRELAQIYPSAKFVLTHRDPEAWADSFGATIYTVMAQRDQFPQALQAWLSMAYGVVARAGFPSGLSREELIRAFRAHNDAVKAAIAPARLLVYQVKEGWGPLCDFLGMEAPDEPFPRSNSRDEFWERLHPKQ
jgi:Sulfotransferase domain